MSTGLNEISDELRTVDNYTRILQSEQRDLVKSLSASRERALRVLECAQLPPGAQDECHRIRLEIAGTRIVFNYSLVIVIRHRRYIVNNALLAFC